MIKTIFTGLAMSMLAACGLNGEQSTQAPRGNNSEVKVVAEKAEITEPPVITDLKTYVGWVKDPSKGLVVSKPAEGYSFELSYRPHLLELLSGLYKDEKLTDERIAALLKSYKGMQYYHLRVQEQQRKISDLRFNEGAAGLAEYLGYQAEKHFSLVSGKDTLAPALFHYENTYPHVPYLSFIIAFKDNDPQNALTRDLHIRDLIHSSSDIILSINNSNIQNQPIPKNINETWH